MADLFILRSQSLPEDTRVVGFRGTETLSRPYAFEVFLQITGPEAHSFDVGDAVGGKAALVTSRDDDRDPFVLAGMFSEVALLHEMDERAVLRGVLVPHLWHLSQTLHSRLFTQQSIPEIIEAVLQESAITSSDYELRLAGQYKPEEHVCQYAESDLDFLSRWMEREGLYYFFEHSEEGEKLIITDSKSFHKDLTSNAMRYFPQTGKDRSAGEHLESFVCRQRHLPASVRYKDYDYTKPTLDVAGKASVSKNGLGEIHLHGARIFTPDSAKRIAKLRAEQIQSRERVFTGAGTALYLRSGCTFSLTDHPRAAFDTSYLAIEVEHQANQLAGSGDLRRLTGLDTDEVYRVHVTAIPAEVQFRAEEATAWPRIYGTEHGVIDGEAESEYAQLDDHGRYLVRFAFDESSLKDGKASTWVRMMQPHGGGVEGWHFPLRKGTEVLFTFLGGDPDRPVIAGVVPNALKPSPVTRANHTKNVIQTGGRNRVEMEDKAGYERITISTPHQDSYVRFGAPNDDHTMIIHTNGPTLIDAGANLDVTVEAEKHETVRADTREWYMAAKDETVTGQSKVTVHGGQDETYSAQTTLVKGDKTETVNGGFVLKVGSGFVTKVGADWDWQIGGNVNKKIGGNADNFHFGHKADLILGTSTKVVIGMSTDVVVANKNGVVLGARLQLIEGLRFDINIGARVDANIGLYLQANSSPQLRIGPAAMDFSKSKVGSFTNFLASAAAWLTSNRITIQNSGSIVMP